METLISYIYRFGELYHQIFKYPRNSAQVIINSSKGVVLVKPTYTSQYYFPGGGIKPNELPKKAAIREVKEELRINLTPVDLKLFGKFTNHRFGWHDTIWLFITNHQLSENSRHKNFEIHHCIYVNSHNYQNYNLSSASRRRLTEYFSQPQKHPNKSW